MRLYRYSLARFRGKLSASSNGGLSADVQGVGVRIHPRDDSEKSKGWRLVQASVELACLPPLDETKAIIIPREPRELCERATEHMLNVVSVLESCGKDICSPNLSVALEASNETERDFLAASRGILALNTHESAVGSPIVWTPEIAQGLADRMDGVALLSESLSAGSEGGRYRELVRLLELAFGLGANDQRLKSALVRYFQHVPGYGYTVAEVAEWLKLRAPSSHADLKKTKWVALGSDVRHVVMRLHQACIDLLLNKTAWRSAASDRRDLWQPEALTTSSKGACMVVKQNAKLTTFFRVFDEFGVHPRILEVSVDHSKDGFYATFVQGKLPAHA